MCCMCVCVRKRLYNILKNSLLNYFDCSLPLLHESHWQPIVAHSLPHTQPTITATTMHRSTQPRKPNMQATITQQHHLHDTTSTAQTCTMQQQQPPELVPTQSELANHHQLHLKKALNFFNCRNSQKLLQNFKCMSNYYNNFVLQNFMRL